MTKAISIVERFSTLLLLFLIAGFSACAQDIIITRVGDDISAKVMEVGTTEIRYRKFTNLEGPVYTILRTDVIKIQYENGTEDIFGDPNWYTSPGATATRPSAAPDMDMYIRGRNDGTRYYRGYKSAGTGTLVTSLLSPIAGLVPAIACSATPPKQHNLHYPSGQLMQDPEYARGYAQEARRIKKNKVWMNWGIGFGANLLLFLVLTN
jgi:hypothetical protein